MAKELGEEKLLFREWLVALVALLLVVSFVWISFPVSCDFSQSCHSISQVSQPKTIQVLVTGAVERPGSYEVPPGTSVAVLLQEIGFKPSADKRGVYLKKTLLSSCSVNVPEKKRKKKQEKK